MKNQAITLLKNENKFLFFFCKKLLPIKLEKCYIDIKKSLKSFIHLKIS